MARHFKAQRTSRSVFVGKKNKAGLPKKCIPHGLRKCAAKKLAEADVREYMLMSILGWTNPIQAKKYIEKASRAKMAKLGMDMLSGEQKKD